MGSNPVAIRKNSLPFLLVIVTVAAALLYFNFQSISLDDFDSVSFALALNHFDISLQQPHPPGFPVYVAMGQLAHAVIPDARAALTLVSAVAGSVGVAAMLWLGTELDNPITGIVAALCLMLLPGYWLPSEIALSDVPGVTLIILAVACLWKGRKNWRWLAAGAAVSGLCLGLRPQNAIPVVIFGLRATAVQLNPHPKSLSLRARDLRTGRDEVAVWQHLSIILAIGLVAILIWLIPTVNASGGLAHYLSLVQAHSQHVMQSDSLFGHPVDGATLTARIEAFLSGLVELAGGVSWVAGVTLVILLLGFLGVNWRSGPARLCALWLIIVAVQVFLFESLERPRLYLPFIPPLILLAAMGWRRLSIKRRYLLTVPLLLVGLSAFAAFPLARTLNQRFTPPFLATLYVGKFYPPDQTIIVTQGSYRHVEWQLPQYRDIYLNTPDVTFLAKPVAIAQPKYLVLMDRDDVWPEAYDALTKDGDYVPIDEQIFSRDPHVFPQHSLVRLEVLTPIKQIDPALLALPMAGVIQVSDLTNARYFNAGWYRSEDIGGVSARWTQQTAEMRVMLASTDFTMTVEAAPYPQHESAEVIINGQSIGMLEFGDPWKPVSIDIPAKVLAGYEISTIQFRHAQAVTPSGSNRSLAVAYRTITFTSR